MPLVPNVKNVNLALITHFLTLQTDFLITGFGPDEYMNGYADKTRTK